MDSKQIEIVRLSKNKPDQIIDLIPGLYQVDLQAFKKVDQYGLELIKLVLLQPHAFWLARRGNSVLGYLSIFLFRSNKLYNRLKNEAIKGFLDLTDLVNDYSMYLDEESPLDKDKEETIVPLHIYIDAIAISKKYEGETDIITFVGLVLYFMGGTQKHVANSAPQLSQKKEKESIPLIWECEECGAEISESDKTCPKCGAEFE